MLGSKLTTIRKQFVVFCGERVSIVPVDVTSKGMDVNVLISGSDFAYFRDKT